MNSDHSGLLLTEISNLPRQADHKSLEVRGGLGEHFGSDAKLNYSHVMIAAAAFPYRLVVGSSRHSLYTCHQPSVQATHWIL